MKLRLTRYTVILILVSATVLAGCVLGKQLLTNGAMPSDVAGEYTLMLYGCHYPDDVKNVALLVKEGSKYPLEIFDLDTSYKVKKHVPADQALAEADAFLRCTGHRVTQTGLRRIPDDSGGTIGYEVRPLYFPLEFGFPDILQISYALKDGVVRAYIRLQPDVEKAIESSGSNDRDSSGK